MLLSGWYVETWTVSPCVYPPMYAEKIRGTLKIVGSHNEKSVFPGKKWYNTSQNTHRNQHSTISTVGMNTYM